MSQTIRRRIVVTLVSSALIGLPPFSGVIRTEAIVSATPAAAAQSEHASFDVTSIKLNRTGDGATRLGFDPSGRFHAVNELLWRVIAEAYQTTRVLWRFEVLGIPDTLANARFDIEAVPGQMSSLDQRRLMLRTMLADRFKLQAHHETRQGDVYFLVRARADGRPGERLTPSRVDCSWARKGETPPPQLAGQPRPCVMQFGSGRLSGDGRTMAEFAEVLSTFAERVVIDRTGLDGAFQWTLEWAPNSLGGAAANADAVSLFTAIQEQLGLKLEAGRGPVDVLVVDHVEAPSEN
jgi:uncharacterized protein (TIGR03435 family)